MVVLSEALTVHVISVPADSNHGLFQGHELTLRVLYRLFGEAEEHHDFFSSTTATSVYETFLLAVVCVIYLVSSLSLSISLGVSTN